MHAALQTLRDEHEALAAMLRSLALLAERGPQGEPHAFFEALRGMLFYLDEVTERLHHPRESNHLFPRVARLAPETASVIRKLEADHQSGERRVRELQHLLTAWEVLGEARREAFVAAARDYVALHLAHIELEETEVFAAAGRVLSGADWAELENMFAADSDPAAAGATRHSGYDRLFSRIVAATPAPLAAPRNGPAAQAASSAG
ncbi:MAG: hemerythrin domain-containing protein [Ramlibacter sp.]